MRVRVRVGVRVRVRVRRLAQPGAVAEAEEECGQRGVVGERAG